MTNTVLITRMPVPRWSSYNIVVQINILIVIELSILIKILL